MGWTHPSLFKTASVWARMLVNHQQEERGRVPKWILERTELARATIEQVRVRLFKLGARVRRSVRRLWFHLASGWPGQPLFERVLEGLAAIGAP